MEKRVRRSDIKPETMEELIEKVKSQAATIQDLKEESQTQSANRKELSALYISRYSRLEDNFGMCLIFLVAVLLINVAIQSCPNNINCRPRACFDN